MARNIFTLFLDEHLCFDTTGIYHNYRGSVSVQENQMVQAEIEDRNS
jgi:hypothetical protein